MKLSHLRKKGKEGDHGTFTVQMGEGQVATSGGGLPILEREICFNAYLKTHSSSDFLQLISQAQVMLKKGKKNNKKMLELLRALSLYRCPVEYVDIFLTVLQQYDDSKVLRMVYYFLEQLPPLPKASNSTLLLQQVMQKELNHQSSGRRVLALRVFGGLAPTDDYKIESNLMDIITKIMQLKKGKKGDDLKSLVMYHEALKICLHRFPNNNSLFNSLVTGMESYHPIATRYAAAACYSIQELEDVKRVMEKWTAADASEKSGMVNLGDSYTRMEFVKICGLLASSEAIYNDDSSLSDQFLQTLCQFLIDVDLKVTFEVIKQLSEYGDWDRISIFSIKPTNPSLQPYLKMNKKEVGVIEAIIKIFEIMNLKSVQNPCLLHSSLSLISTLAKSFSTFSSKTKKERTAHCLSPLLSHITHFISKRDTGYVSLSALKCMIWMTTSEDDTTLFDVVRIWSDIHQHVSPDLYREVFVELKRRLKADIQLLPLVLRIVADLYRNFPEYFFEDIVCDMWAIALPNRVNLKVKNSRRSTWFSDNFVERKMSVSSPKENNVFCVLDNMFSMLDYNAANNSLIWHIKKVFYAFLAMYIGDIMSYILPVSTDTSVGFTPATMSIVLRLKQATQFHPWEIRGLCVSGLAWIWTIRPQSKVSLHIYEFFLTLFSHKDCVFSPILSYLVDILTEFYHLKLKEKKVSEDEEEKTVKQIRALIGIAVEEKAKRKALSKKK